MSWLSVLRGVILLLISWTATAQDTVPDADIAVEPSTIGFDLSLIGPDGLIGAADARRALDYEYCIPDDPRVLAEVQAIDPSARPQPGVRGRIGCRVGEVLVLGNSHQPDAVDVLRRLERLPYIRRIERAWFE
jgi:hypothetical protein